MTQGLFLIKDTAFNRENYPTLIGERFEMPPAYAQGAWERDEFAKMPVTELVAYWNILQMSRRMIQMADTKAANVRHRTILAELFTEMNIPHEDDKLIKTVRVKRAA